MISIGGKLEVPEQPLAEFCRRWNVVELSVFGSVLRDDFGPDSDVDFLAVFAPGDRHTIFDLVSMEADLSRLIGRPVDFVERRAVERCDNPYRRRTILDSAQVVFRV